VPTLAQLRRPLNFLIVVAMALTAFAAVSALSAGRTGASRAHAATLTFRQEAVQIAATKKGDPYRYGAAGPNAFDCSGLTLFVYSKVGVKLAHNAEEQYFQTWHKTHREKRRGDLIFYTSNGRASGIYHVALYAGNGYTWVAPHTGSYVHRQRIYSSHYLVGRPHK
jgi:cell wall-associated NlpC family hydrolase